MFEECGFLSEKNVGHILKYIVVDFFLVGIDCISERAAVD